MSTTEIDRQWTTRLRKRVAGKLPPEKMLPDTQPAYVASWIYVFGVATLAALGVVIGTGCILAMRGPQWWHGSSYGHFINSMHLWSVEIFFFSMVVHLWGKFFMAAWRGGRALTWMTGVRDVLRLDRRRLHRLRQSRATSTRSGSRPRRRTASTPPAPGPTSTC